MQIVLAKTTNLCTKITKTAKFDVKTAKFIKIPLKLNPQKIQISQKSPQKIRISNFPDFLQHG